MSLRPPLKVAKVYRGWTAWRGGSLHDARRTGEVPGPVQGVRPRDEQAGTAGRQDRRGPDEGGAACRVQGGFRMARRDDRDSAELVHERMGPRTSRGDRRDGAIRQVRGIAGHVHRVTSISLLPEENPKSLRTPADETAESIRRAERAKPYSRSRLACTRGIALMEFRNERTWQNAADLGKTEDFHLNYEAAVGKVRAAFGDKHPIIIDGKEVWSKATFPDTSPADTSLVLGHFQKGTRSHAKQAIKAARAAFPGWSATPYLERVRTIQRASDTPYIGLKLCELLHEAGLPPGVFNYVTGPGATVGQELVDNEGVDGFVFTGSRTVGLAAFKTFTRERPKPIITEMGGKNPTIVTASADLEKAAIGVTRAAVGYGGQKCSACSRVLVDRTVKAGVLYANRAAGATTGAVVGVQPFGGWKMSGTSGKSAGGHYYLPQFMREQSQSEYAS